MNYTELQTKIVQWCGKPAVSQAVATCVEMLEADLNRRLSEASVVGAMSRSTSTLSVGENVSAAPGDLKRAIRMIRVADGILVESVTEPGLAALKEAAPTLTGEPLYYSLIGTEFRYYPSPDASCVVELTYQGGLEPLTADNASNWILATYPDVYLYGGLAQVGGFLADPDMQARWMSQYLAAVDGLVKAERAKRGHQRAASYRPDLPMTSGYDSGYFLDRP